MADGTPHEIEAKFLVKDSSAFAQLLQAGELAPGYALGPIAEVSVVDTYVDTADFRLLRNGYGLRIRQLEGARLATLKSTRAGDTGSIFHRVEVETPLATDVASSSLGGWPAAILQELGHLADEAAQLHTLCVLRQRRIKRPLTVQRRTSPQQRKLRTVPMAEVSMDTVAVCADAESSPLAHSYEIEIELLPEGDARELYALVTALQELLSLAPSPRSKLEHALTVLTGPWQTGDDTLLALQPELEMAEACRLLWHRQLIAMCSYEAGLRHSDSPANVAGMAAATHRARAVAALGQAYFRPKAMRRFLKALRQTARRLEAVAEVDGAMARLQRYAGKEGADTHAFAGTMATCQRRRDAAFDALMAWLDGEPYRRFVVRFATFCRSPGKGSAAVAMAPGEPPPLSQVRHVLPKLLLRSFLRVRVYESAFQMEDVVTLKTLLRLRRDCHRLCRELELFDELLGQEVVAILGVLRTLQTQLDELYDADVGARLVDEGPERDTPAAQRHQRTQARVVIRAQKRVAAALARVVAPVNRRRFALAIAGI